MYPVDVPASESNCCVFFVGENAFIVLPTKDIALGIALYTVSPRSFFFFLVLSVLIPKIFYI